MTKWVLFHWKSNDMRNNWMSFRNWGAIVRRKKWHSLCLHGRRCVDNTSLSFLLIWGRGHETEWSDREKGRKDIRGLAHMHTFWMARMHPFLEGQKKSSRKLYCQDLLPAVYVRSNLVTLGRCPYERSPGGPPSSRFLKIQEEVTLYIAERKLSANTKSNDTLLLEFSTSRTVRNTFMFTNHLVYVLLRQP